MTRDILTGTVEWRGLGVINPFGPDGKLVPLNAYPKLAAYLEQHGAAIKARHVSKKNPGTGIALSTAFTPSSTPFRNC